ncbi:thiolase family protein [Candidatus Methanoperedens nitratireducens]|nr:hypothetical protein [Candidatus Methanoperedens nitroreducens]
MMRNVVIASACRTAVGKFGGSLKELTPGQLGSVVLKDALKRAGVKSSEVDEVIMGNVLSAGHGQNVARQAAMAVGIPVEVSSYCVWEMQILFLQAAWNPCPRRLIS